MAFSSLLAVALFCSPAACDQSFVGLESLPLSRGIEWDMARKSSKNKWDESKVKRDESGRFIAQANHVERQDAGAYRLNNQFDPLKGPGTRTRLDAFTGKPVGPLVGPNRQSLPSRPHPQNLFDPLKKRRR